jgi:hypothetical protein
VNLSQLAFESGSRLLILGDYAFYDCLSLHSIVIPPHLGQVTGLSFVGSEITNIAVDPESELLTISGGLLLHSGGHRAIRYFRNEGEVSISGEIGAISAGCFCRCTVRSNVMFAPDCKVSILGELAFSSCLSLQSICIPASVETISTRCFSSCMDLSDLTFESGSRLSTIGEQAFHRCLSLTSICIPRSVTVISRDCFGDCENLKRIVLERGSPLSDLSLIGLPCTCRVDVE